MNYIDKTRELAGKGAAEVREHPGLSIGTAVGGASGFVVAGLGGAAAGAAGGARLGHKVDKWNRRGDDAER